MALKYKHKLLFVDDEESITKALYRIFRRQGYEIHTASSGQEGLEMLKKDKKPFSLIISDCIISHKSVPWGSITGTNWTGKLMKLQGVFILQ